MSAPIHVPVLLDEVLDWLMPQPGQVLADGTLGGGGHTGRLAERLHIRTCEEVTGTKIPTVEKPRRPGDPPKLVASAAKAIGELGWKPRYPKLKDIVSTAWTWHKKHETGYPD